MLIAMKGQVPVANRLLAALPRIEYQRIRADLEPVSLVFGTVLHEAGATIKYMYFPNEALISLLTVVERQQSLEVGMTGQEGMVGIALALGASVPPVRAMVQGSDSAMRMKAALFRKAFRQSLPLQRAVHLYTHTLMAQIAQTAACNRFHVVEARLAFRILVTSERACSDHIFLTHKFLSDLLGVRRVGVTEAAYALKQRKLIDYGRGNITITHRCGLEAASCSCYGIARNHRAKT